MMRESAHGKRNYPRMVRAEFKDRCLLCDWREATRVWVRKGDTKYVDFLCFLCQESFRDRGYEVSPVE